MKLANLLNELKEKDFFKKFIAENPDAFFAAGFIVLDDSGEDKYQLDYFIPSKKKIASVEFPFKQMKIHEDVIEKADRLKVAMIDICDLRERVEEIKKNKAIALRTNKIIALLKDDLWQLTCLSDTLDMLKIHVHSVNGEVKRCEKLNLFSMIGKPK